MRCVSSSVDYAIRLGEVGAVVDSEDGSSHFGRVIRRGWYRTPYCTYTDYSTGNATNVNTFFFAYYLQYV